MLKEKKKGEKQKELKRKKKKYIECLMRKDSIFYFPKFKFF